MYLKHAIDKKQKSSRWYAAKWKWSNTHTYAFLRTLNLLINKELRGQREHYLRENSLIVAEDTYLGKIPRGAMVTWNLRPTCDELIYDGQVLYTRPSRPSGQRNYEGLIARDRCSDTAQLHAFTVQTVCQRVTTSAIIESSQAHHAECDFFAGFWTIALLDNAVTIPGISTQAPADVIAWAEMVGQAWDMLPGEIIMETSWYYSYGVRGWREGLRRNGKK